MIWSLITGLHHTCCRCQGIVLRTPVHVIAGIIKLLTKLCSSITPEPTEMASGDNFKLSLSPSLSLKMAFVDRIVLPVLQLLPIHMRTKYLVSVSHPLTTLVKGPDRNYLTTRHNHLAMAKVTSKLLLRSFHSYHPVLSKDYKSHFWEMSCQNLLSMQSHGLIPEFHYLPLIKKIKKRNILQVQC